MGREVRRVPLDFNWPLNKTWTGFLNPFGGRCPEDQKTCFNGESSGSAWVSAILRLLTIAADDANRGVESRSRGQNFPHPYLVDLSGAPTYSIPRPKDDSPQAKQAYFAEFTRRSKDRENWVLPPSKDLVEFVAKFSKSPGASSFGYYNLSWDMRKALLAAVGLPENWGTCPVCGGEGDDPAKRAEVEAWKETPPPEGPGWQLWETTSEGSPISPVFPTQETFIEYLMGEGYSAKAAENFAKDGWAPSAMVIPGVGFVDGIASAEFRGK